MRGLVICLLFSLAGPALADTTAVYERVPSNFKMTVEIATNGDVRGDIGGKPGAYFLTRNGTRLLCYPDTQRRASRSRRR